ncbi:MAG: response regulator [Chloroflexi bacterium]|nr:response regulator [Chloroflexota bacterium]
MVKILVVEDNEDNRDMLIRRLERRGFQVVVALDGASAVEMARDASPDLILMDMGLPILDGWQATSLIRHMPQTRSIPIIGLSANAMAGDREKGLAAGCNDYDTKPVDMGRLLEKIGVVLNRNNPS